MRDMIPRCYKCGQPVKEGYAVCERHWREALRNDSTIYKPQRGPRVPDERHDAHPDDFGNN